MALENNDPTKTGGKSPKVNVYQNPDGSFEVESIASGKTIFKTYNSSGTTPGGSASGFNQSDPNEFVNYFQSWIDALDVSPDEITSSQDFQKRIYQHELEKNPQRVQDIWSKIGLNNAALKDTELTRKLISSGALNPEKGNVLDFSKVSDEDKKTLLGDLAPHYADGMIGARSLSFTPTKVERTNDPGIATPKRPDITGIELPETIAKPSLVLPKPEASEQGQAAQTRKKGGWYIQDTVNLAGALTDKINRYEPLLSQIDLDTVDPVFRDPSRMIAASQEQQAKYQDMVSNSMDPSVAASVMMGANGQSFEQIANGISQVENDNVGIANSTRAGNAQIQNQEQIANANGLQKYIGEMATLNQNTDNAKALKKSRVGAAWNNGMNNWFRKKQMEQVLFPQTYQDPITGEFSFSDVGQNLNGANTYQGSGAQTAANIEALKAAQIQSNLEMIKNLKSQGFSDDDIKLAGNMGIGTGRTSTAFNDRMLYAQMMNGAIPETPTFPN